MNREREKKKETELNVRIEQYKGKKQTITRNTHTCINTSTKGYIFVYQTTLYTSCMTLKITTSTIDKTHLFLNKVQIYFVKERILILIQKYCTNDFVILDYWNKRRS